jgi:hypothetical protein
MSLQFGLIPVLGNGRVCLPFAEPFGCDYINWEDSASAGQNNFLANDQSMSEDCGLFHVPSSTGSEGVG